MNRILYISALAIVLFSCIKKVEDPRIIADKELENYLRSNNIPIIKANNVLYYTSSIIGTGQQPDSGDYVMIHYTGSLLNNGKIIGTSDSIKAESNNIIPATYHSYPLKTQVKKLFFGGLIEGIKLMKEGGKTRFIVPYNLGLGMIASKTIPAYSNLIFDVELIKVIKNPDDSTQFKGLLDSLGINHSLSSIDSVVYIIHDVVGTGIIPKNGDTAIVRYASKLTDGFATPLFSDTLQTIVVDSTHYLGKGIKLMNAGGKARLFSYYKIAFGANGLYGRKQDFYTQQLIPPYSSFITDIELVQVKINIVKK